MNPESSKSVWYIKSYSLSNFINFSIKCIIKIFNFIILLCNHKHMIEDQVLSITTITITTTLIYSCKILIHIILNFVDNCISMTKFICFNYSRQRDKFIILLWYTRDLTLYHMLMITS